MKEMSVYIIFLFDRDNYPSTTEYIAVFTTKEKAEKYVKENSKNYGSRQELYFEKKIVG